MPVKKSSSTSRNHNNKQKQHSKAMQKYKPQGIQSMFPNKKFIQMKWNYQDNISTGTTLNSFGTAKQIYLNLLTPLATGPAFRVQGYDQVKEIYNKYKVFACKIKCTVSNQSATGLYVGFRLHDSGLGDGIYGETVQIADMKKWTVTKALNSAGDNVVYERYCEIAAIDGLTKTQMTADIDNYNGSFISATGPVKKPYWEVALINPNSTTNHTAQVNIEMTYYVQLYDRQTLANSSAV